MEEVLIEVIVDIAKNVAGGLITYYIIKNFF